MAVHLSGSVSELGVPVFMPELFLYNKRWLKSTLVKENITGWTFLLLFVSKFPYFSWYL